MSEILNYLFETNAVKISEASKPFWLTSGKIAPFYINAQFLYGNEMEANKLLAIIDEKLSDKPSIPAYVTEEVIKQYEKNSIFKNTINLLMNKIKENINVDEIDYIAGGERRDWYFSYIIAKLLNKPHITIYKDLSTMITDTDLNVITPDVKGKKVLHVADLITEASSFERSWVPAINIIGAKIVWSIVAVDRMQGGEQKLNELGIQSNVLVKIDETLFDEALKLGVINEEQKQMLVNYKKNPDETMRKFLIDNPKFLQDALMSDAKTAKRAKVCIESNLYNL